jgi:Response regulator containing a CheY-like receiver domain and an HD-GYP domain
MAVSFLRGLLRRPEAVVRTDAALDAQLELLHRLARVAEYRDDDTGQHIHRVAWLSARLARALNRPPDEVEELYVAAPLHDVGKVAVPDRILLKRGSLTSAEHMIMRTHTTVGGQMLGGSSFPYVRTAATIALSHHERWDGTGYPQGLTGEDIPLPGRLVAVADVLDALVSPRPYKEAWPLDRALEEIESQRGRHFDPAIVDVLLAIIDVEGLPPEVAAGGTRVQWARDDQDDQDERVDRHRRVF